jgi:hypothetical protein
MTEPSWLYPFKVNRLHSRPPPHHALPANSSQGIYYFTSHPYLYPLLKARLLPCLLLSLFVLSTLFIWAYIPQALFLLLFHGPLAWPQAALLCLAEGSVIIQLLFEAFFVDETLVDVFDAVLVAEGLADLVAQRRVVHAEVEGGVREENPVRRLGKHARSAVYAPFSLRQIVEFVVFLPFNLLPVVGTPVFLLLTGYRAGPLQHHRYYKLLGYGSKERKAAVRKRKLRYTWFGAVQLLLQLVPGLSMLFLLTTATGSALWAVKLEKIRRGTMAIESAGEEYRDGEPGVA